MAIPSAHLHVVDEHAAVPVVVACASDDYDAVQAAIRPLGGVTEVVDGLEYEPTALRDAALAADRPTLYVVCKTDALSPAVVRRTVECFGARTTAGHRLLVLELIPRRTAGFVGTLRRAREQLGRACQQRGITTRFGMRDSSVAGSLGGETIVDPAKPSIEPRGRSISVTFPTDRVGPIPPHVRTPTPPRRAHLSVVPDDGEPAEEPATESCADLSPPSHEPAESTSRPLPSPPRGGMTWRLVALAIAGLATAAGLLLGSG